jgi:RNA polymerase sigma-70 factor (sigma-E family)
MTNTRPPPAPGTPPAPAPTGPGSAPATMAQAIHGTEPPPGEAGWEDQAFLAAYRTHYRSLVHQAAQLLRDIAAAEDVVQDSFIALHVTRPQLADGANALPYLRRSVANRSRSLLRHRIVAGQHPPAPVADMPSAEDTALTRAEHSAVISALSLLAPRQRQVLALRYYADLSEAQIAAALGISRGTVKTHAARGLTSLRPVLGSRA